MPHILLSDKHKDIRTTSYIKIFNIFCNQRPVTLHNSSLQSEHFVLTRSILPPKDVNHSVTKKLLRPVLSVLHTRFMWFLTVFSEISSSSATCFWVNPVHDIADKPKRLPQNTPSLMKTNPGIFNRIIQRQCKLITRAICH